jgi:pimeloyl-ACP methyl ester carboxylesterase
MTAAQPSAATSPDIITILGGATAEYISTYTLEDFQTIITSGLVEFMSASTMKHDFDGKLSTPKYPVKLYRILYPSVVPERNDLPTMASGLVAIPQGKTGPLPVVSYQHGTVFDRSYVPSNPNDSGETKIMLAQFAAQGYVVIGADYFGRGQSDLPDSYLVRDSSRRAVFDFYRTARNFLEQQDIQISHLFVSGWSQGGWVTMQFLRLLEASNIKVTAAAIASAPVDVFLTVSRWMNNWQEIDANYIPGAFLLQLLAREYYHQWDGLAASAFKAEYVDIARAFYRGDKTWENFVEATKGQKLADLVRPEFRASAYTGNGLYWHSMHDSQAYLWRSVTPLHVYLGGKDEVTPEIVGRLPQQTQKLLGGAPVETVFVDENADHRAIFVGGTIEQKTWFDTLLAGG